MSDRNPTDRQLTQAAFSTEAAGDALDAANELQSLLVARPRATVQAPSSVIVGELLAITEFGQVPLVSVPGQNETTALRARTVVDLHGHDIGRTVVLMFEGGDAAKPVIMGVLKGDPGWPLDATPGQVEVEADGERVVVSAKEQLVLRCGKASITLTKAGKVSIEGAYVSSRATGANRIKGGSVQIN